MKKSSKTSLKKRSLDISLQHKNEASYIFSKKNFCTWPKTGLALKGLILTKHEMYNIKKKNITNSYHKAKPHKQKVQDPIRRAKTPRVKRQTGVKVKTEP